MNHGAGFLTVACTCLVILTQSVDAGHAPKKHSAGLSCKPKELTALTKSLLQASLTAFDEANGQDLGTWTPGFPELQVHQNAHAQGSKVQCSLHFMAQGLEKILVDQRDNLNPKDVSLHAELKNSISKVKMLTACAKDKLGGECSPNPAPPQMPAHVFDRKQWSHTLLKMARDYLTWLEGKFDGQNPIVKWIKKIIRKTPGAKLQKYKEGSGYLL